MKIILSPAKKMKVDTDSLSAQGIPVFLSKTEEILKTLNALSFSELKALWGCSDKIAEQNKVRLSEADLYNCLTPAVLSYDGIAFQYMAPAVFDEEMVRYVQEKLRILSGFYGVLKPLDGVIPYRLEMQAKLSLAGAKDLYAYWGDLLYKEIQEDNGVIINLASKEYAKCIEPYLKKKDRFITCHFGERVKDKFLIKATYAKMARGEMVRFMAKNEVENPEELKRFTGLGYVFDDDASTDTVFYFNRVNTEEVC